MTKNSTLENLINIERKYKSSEAQGHAFVATEKSFKALTLKKEELIEKIGELSLFWKNAWWIAAIGGICLAIFQGYSAQTVIQAYLDPTAEGSIPLWVFVTIGASISILGMVIGHTLYESVKINKNIGDRNFGPLFYLMLALAIFYVSFQFGLAHFGAEGGLAEGETNSMPYVVGGLAIFEIIIGAFIMEKVLNYLALMFENIVLGLKSRKMARKSRLTNNNFRDYSTLIDAYNSIPEVDLKQREGNDNIRRAIAYYAGIQLPAEEQILPTIPVEPIDFVRKPQPKAENIEQPQNSSLAIMTEEPQVLSTENTANNTIEPRNTNRNNTNNIENLARETTAKEAEAHVEAFLEDTVEADLTV